MKGAVDGKGGLDLRAPVMRPAITADKIPVKRNLLITLMIAALSVTVLSGTRITRRVVPDPKVVLAEDRAGQAATLLFNMNYEGAAAIYRQTLPLIANNMFHRRIYARALAHLGEWDEAARELQRAGTDSRLQAVVEADAERLRALATGRVELAAATGGWKEFKPRDGFAQNVGVGAVAALPDGGIATAVPGDNKVLFWSASGRLRRTVRLPGSPVALAVQGSALWAADMAGDRVYRLSEEQGVTRRIPVETHGCRDVALDADGSLWVVDFGGGAVRHLGADGTMISVLGRDLREPTAVLPDGAEILVAEKGRDRIVRLNRSGIVCREYRHERMRRPVDLVAARGGAIIQCQDGTLFWLRDEQDDLVGPLRASGGELVTSGLGLAIDAWDNLWWGDGASLHTAHRLPEDRPFQVMEILACRFSRPAAQVDLVVSVTGKDGRPIESLDEKSFRVLRNNRMLLPLSVTNLSRAVPGRRILVVREASDAIEPHEESLAALWPYLLRTLGAADATAVMTVTDTWAMTRSFVRSAELVRAELARVPRRTGSTRLVSAAALERAVLLLADTMPARAVLWLTSGESPANPDFTHLVRLARINQVPIFVVHVGGTNAPALQSLAANTGGAYYGLYDAEEPSRFFDALGSIRSGRYRLCAYVDLPTPAERGRWFDITVESWFNTEQVFDKAGYYAY